ncbi:hypothetical protein [Pseudomonas farsensis]|uniref:Uncharacterized protein n=1 Tax=Pseudomonas farsensis TaxID=2745492 RepID=A0ABU8QQ32_9PSED
MTTIEGIDFTAWRLRFKVGAMFNAAAAAVAGNPESVVVGAPYALCSPA